MNLDIEQVAYTLRVERPDYDFERCERVEDAILDSFPDETITAFGATRVREIYLGPDNAWYVTIYCASDVTLEQDVVTLELTIRATK